MSNDEIERMKNKKMAMEFLEWGEDNVDPFDNYDEGPSLGFAGLAILAATFSIGAVTGAMLCLL